MIERVRLNEDVKASSIKSALLPKPPVLLTESADEFDALQKRLEREIKPQNIIEHMYVADYSTISWEIFRLRRCKVVIVNAAFRSALECLLTQSLIQPGETALDVEEEAQKLAYVWFTDEKAKKKISDILERFGLGESAIEAEAIRRSAPDLELIDRMLTSLESRRTKILRCIAEYRYGLAQQLRETTDHILDSSGVLRLKDASSKAAAVG
jgi:hypothetical protein